MSKAEGTAKDEERLSLKRACEALENASLVAQRLADRADTKLECDSYRALAHANQTILARVASQSPDLDGEPASFDHVISDFSASEARIRAMIADETGRDRKEEMRQAERKALAAVRAASSIDSSVRAPSLRELAGLVDALGGTPYRHLR